MREFGVPASLSNGRIRLSDGLPTQSRQKKGKSRLHQVPLRGSDLTVPIRVSRNHLGPTTGDFSESKGVIGFKAQFLILAGTDLPSELTTKFGLSEGR